MERSRKHQHSASGIQVLGGQSKNSIFPFHKLPTELLIEIFTHGESSSRIHREPSLPFPVIVSHVCRRWHKVANQTPTLWTSIKIYNHAHSDLWKGKGLTWTYIQRSKSCLLDVTIYARTSDPDPGVADTAMKFTMTWVVKRIMERIRRLALYGGPVIIAALDELRNFPAPVLQGLRVSLFDGEIALEDRSYSVEIPRMFTGAAPKLTMVQLHGLSCLRQPAFDKLTSLSLWGNDQEQSFELFVDFLRGVSATLVRLSIALMTFFTDLPESSLNPPPLELPALKRLHLADFAMYNAHHTPGMEGLFVESAVPDITLTTLLQTMSSSPLLSLLSMRLDGLDLRPFTNGSSPLLDAVPMLQELEFFCCYKEDVFLKQMIPRGQSWGNIFSTRGVVLPDLRLLTVSQPECWEVLKLVLMARIKRGKSIKQLTYLTLERRVERERWLTQLGIGYTEVTFAHERRDPEDVEWFLEESLVDYSPLARDESESWINMEELDGSDSGWTEDGPDDEIWYLLHALKSLRPVSPAESID